MNKFTVGQRVKSDHFGEGTVMFIDFSATHFGAITVIFDTSDIKRHFNLLGIYTPGDEYDHYSIHPIQEVPDNAVFMVGDIVSAFGYTGTILSINNLVPDTPLEVELDVDGSKKYIYFTVDGKLLPWHKNPFLVLIARKKPATRVKKQFWLRISDLEIQNGSITASLHEKKPSAVTDDTQVVPVELDVLVEE